MVNPAVSRHMFIQKLLKQESAIVFWVAIVLMAALNTSPAASARWWRGNLHTHSLWSDGNDYPEMVAAWYKEHGYDFLSLSDHNVMLEGTRWTDANTNRGGAAAFEKYLKRFGTEGVESRVEGTNRPVRLKTLEEFRGRLEEPGRFLLLPGEEISDRFKSAPIHMNATNLRERVKPPGGESIHEVMQNNVDAVLAQRERTGQPMIPHINHPNFCWALTAEDMMRVRGERFFEVYNGHPGVRNTGDTHHASTERIWDILLTRRLAELGLDPMWATAVDDAHEYHGIAMKQANPGRGWIMVRAAKLTPATLIAAMEAGDFYASTGVHLKGIRRTKNKLSIKVDAEPGVTYTTQFIGTRRGFDAHSEPVLDQDGKEIRTTRRYSEDIGRVLQETKGTSASYKLKGDEIYVRAKVVSSRPKANPSSDGDHEAAWVQPVVGEVKRATR